MGYCLCERDVCHVDVSVRLRLSVVKSMLWKISVVFDMVRESGVGEIFNDMIDNIIIFNVF